MQNYMLYSIKLYDVIDSCYSGLTRHVCRFWSGFDPNSAADENNNYGKYFRYLILAELLKFFRSSRCQSLSLIKKTRSGFGPFEFFRNFDKISLRNGVALKGTAAHLQAGSDQNKIFIERD